MKMTRLLTVCGVLCVMTVSVSSGATGLPFTDDFEGGTWSVADPWSTNGMGSVDDVSGDTPGGGGTYALRVFADTATLTPSNTTFYNVWAQVYAKAVANDGDRSVGLDGSSALFAVTNGGVIRACNGTGANDGTWTSVGTVSMTGGTSSWIGFVVHLDYNNYKWDLYRATSGSAGSATLTAIATNFGFYFNQSFMTDMQIYSEQGALVDEIGLIQGYSDAANPLYTSALSRTQNHVIDSWTPMTVGGHTYGAGADTMGGDLGFDLMMGISDTDQIRVWWTNAWNVFTFNIGAWVESVGTTNVPLDPGETIWKDFAVAVTDSLEFYAAGFVPGGTPPPQSGNSQTVYGTDAALAAGWSHLTYGGTSGGINGVNLNTVLTPGSFAYIAKSGSASYLRYYIHTSGSFYRNGELSTLTLSPGDKLWIFNDEAASASWVYP